MSYARKAKNGYYGYASYQDNNGKWHQKAVGHFKLKREALKAAADKEKELGAVNVELHSITFSDYYHRWYKVYKENSVSEISKSRYLNFYKVICSYFKDNKLADLKVDYRMKLAT